jgi:hypothetical protein
MFDPVARSWEVVFALDAVPPSVPVESWECDAVQAVPPHEWPGGMSDAATQMMPVLEAELRARGR